jgi:uncharacterized protein
VSTPPLALDTRDLPRRAGSMREVTLTMTTPEQMGAGVIVVSRGESLELDVRMESVSEGVLVTAGVHTRMSGECGYCLEPVSGPLTVQVQQLFTYPGDRRAARGAEELDSDDADLAPLVEDLADLGPGITDAVVLALPFSRLCDDSCPRLAETRAHLGSAEKVDLRWAGLAQLAEQLPED